MVVRFREVVIVEIEGIWPEFRLDIATLLVVVVWPEFMLEIGTLLPVFSVGEVARVGIDVLPVLIVLMPVSIKLEPASAAIWPVVDNSNLGRF